MVRGCLVDQACPSDLRTGNCYNFELMMNGSMVSEWPPITPRWLMTDQGSNSQAVDSSGLRTRKKSRREILDELMTAYIQVEYERFNRLSLDFERRKRSVSFNLGAFVFAEAYFLFRKMYIQGILLAVISTILFSLIAIVMESLYQRGVFLQSWTPHVAIIGLSAAYRIGLALLVDRIYLSHVKSRVKAIMKTNKNYNKKLEMIDREGGITYVGIITSSIIINMINNVLFGFILEN